MIRGGDKEEEDVRQGRMAEQTSPTLDCSSFRGRMGSDKIGDLILLQLTLREGVQCGSTPPNLFELCEFSARKKLN